MGVESLSEATRQAGAATALAGLVASGALPMLDRTSRVARLALCLASLGWAWRGNVVTTLEADAWSLLLSSFCLGWLVGFPVALAADFLHTAVQAFSLAVGLSFATASDPQSASGSTSLGALGTTLWVLLFWCTGQDRLLLELLGGVRCPEVDFQYLMRITSVHGALGQAIGFVVPLLALAMSIDLAISAVARVFPQVPVLAITWPAKLLLAPVAVLLFLRPFAYTVTAMIERALQVSAGLLTGGGSSGF